jgi:hypothetical protein
MKTLTLILSILLLASCSEYDSDCLEKRADTFKSERIDCSGSSIKKYEFNGETLYAFADGNCISDGSTSILDEDCIEVCFLGGIAGFSECYGKDFFAEAKLKETLWEVN